MSRSRRTMTPEELARGVVRLPLPGRSQTNVYLVHSGASWVLVDAGWEKDGPLIEEATATVTGADAVPAAVVLTHVHPDHAGSAPYLSARWDCPVYAHPDEIPFARGDWTAINSARAPLDRWLVLPVMRLMRARRRDAILARSRLDALPFDPAGPLEVLPDWRPVPTPGHTPGHTSFFRAQDRVVITGDALVTLRLNSPAGLLFGRTGLSGPPWYSTWNWPAAKASIATLAGLDPLVIAPGHGRPLADRDTPRALRNAAR